MAASRGGFYSPEAPHVSFEHQTSHLRIVFGFMSITDLEIMEAEGVARGPELHEKALKGALDGAARLPA